MDRASPSHYNLSAASFVAATATNIDKVRIDKINAAAVGLQPEFTHLLSNRVSKENGLDIATFILAMRTEIDLADSYRKSLIRTLCYLSEHAAQQLFREMTRDDVISYLETARKSKEADPLDRWYFYKKLSHRFAQQEHEH